MLSEVAASADDDADDDVDGADNFSLLLVIFFAIFGLSSLIACSL